MLLAYTPTVCVLKILARFSPTVAHINDIQSNKRVYYMINKACVISRVFFKEQSFLWQSQLFARFHNVARYVDNWWTGISKPLLWHGYWFSRKEFILVIYLSMHPCNGACYPRTKFAQLSNVLALSLGCVIVQSPMSDKTKSESSVRG